VKRSILRLLPAAAVTSAIVPAAIAAGGSAPEGQPLLPDLDQETPSGLVLTKARSGWRLGFDSAVRNIGDGPLIIDGERPSAGVQAMSADQVVVNAGGPRTVAPGVGRLRFVRSPDHRHWHLLGFDRYELRRADSGERVVADRKSGFCLGDRYPVRTRAVAAKPPEPVYRSRCGLDRPGMLGIREGISPGYGDNYAANLEGQYLPLNGLRPGRYLLVHRVNADRRIRESSYGNNASSLLLSLRLRDGEPRMRVLGVCPDTEQCSDGSRRATGRSGS
jgi:Lysyl oxidase